MILFRYAYTYLYITANDIYMTTEVGFSKFRKIKIGREATAPLKGAHI